MPNLSLTLSKHFSASRTRLVAFSGMLVAIGLISLLAAVPGDAAVKTKRIVLGEATNKLEPNCGKNFSRDCIVEGKMTGYQVYRKGSPRKRGFVVPWTGKIVSWSISLARPTKQNITKDGTTHGAQLPAFNDAFGAPASARIAVLRQVDKKKKGPPKWRMVRQSPVQILNPYFGRTVHFSLTHPLNVYRDQMVALTIPTWAPALWRPRVCNETVTGPLDPAACDNAEKAYTWRASRAKDKCNIGFDPPGSGIPNEALKKTGPQTKVGSERRYGCYYGSNVLLYTATVIGKN